MATISTIMKRFTRGRLEIFIQILIVVSMVAFAVETVPDIPSSLRYCLEWVEGISNVVFVVEYLVRLWFAPVRLGFVFSFFGIIDLLAILPLFFFSTADLRPGRVFRLLRLFRILKLARYNAAVRRFHLALMIAKEEIVLFLALTSIVLFLAAVGIYHFENEAQPEHFRSVFHSLWWSVTTLTTVGYGDMYPLTAGGRLFTFVVLIVGLGIVSVPAGLVASALQRARSIESQEVAVGNSKGVDSTASQGGLPRDAQLR